MDQELDLGNILCGFQLRVFSSALYELMFLQTRVYGPGTFF